LVQKSLKCAAAAEHDLGTSLRWSFAVSFGVNDHTPAFASFYAKNASQ
jgi:hypothetical protein